MNDFCHQKESNLFDLRLSQPNDLDTDYVIRELIGTTVNTPRHIQPTMTFLPSQAK